MRRRRDWEAERTSEARHGCDAHESVAAVQAGGDIDIALAGDGQALWAAEAAIPDARVAVGLDGPDGFVGRKRRAVTRSVPAALTAR